jgi:Tfp pilus assembly protein PilF
MGKKNKKRRIEAGEEKDVRQKDISFNPGAERKLKTRLGIFIAILAFLLYAQTISYDYAYDDFMLINENKIVQQGISGIPQLLTSDYLAGFTDKGENDKTALIYRPASLVMFALEWQLMPDTSQLSHFINVLLYALTCFLLFLLMCRIFRSYSIIVPFVCTVLFTIHPIHTEVVSNIKSRDEILCLLFAVCSCINFLKYYSDQNKKWLIAGSLFFFFSLLSKETGITYLACIPLLLFVVDGVNGRRLALSIAVLLALTGLYFFIRSQVDIGISTAGKISYFDNIMVRAESQADRLATAFSVLGKYLYLMIIPHPLISDYSYAQLEQKTMSDAGVIISVLLHLIAFIYAMYNIRKKSLVAFGILFYLITLSPVSNILFLIGSNMGERFLYTPSVGFCIVVVMLIVKIGKADYSMREFVSVSQFISKYSTLLTVMALLFTVYIIKTFSRNIDWRNNLSLFAQDSKQADRSARAHYEYGSALIKSIDSSEMTLPEIDERINSAMGELKKVIAIYPDNTNTNTYAHAHFTIGDIFRVRRKYDSALYYMERAIKYYPGTYPIYYKNIGYVYLKIGQYDQSISAIDSFLTRNPVSGEVLNIKGSGLFGKLRYHEALQLFLKADSLKGNDSLIVKNIGRSYAYLKQYEKAGEYFKKAIQLEPGNSSNYRFLGFSYQFMNDTVRAGEMFRRANEIDAGLLPK